jgi:hypothetical protein
MALNYARLNALLLWSHSTVLPIGLNVQDYEF